MIRPSRTFVLLSVVLGLRFERRLVELKALSLLEGWRELGREREDGFALNPDMSRVRRMSGAEMRDWRARLRVHHLGPSEGVGARRVVVIIGTSHEGRAAAGGTPWEFRGDLWKVIAAASH